MPAPDLAVVVEWESLAYSKRARCAAVLTRLAHQVRECQAQRRLGAVEMLLCLDPTEASPAESRQFVLEVLGPDASRFDLGTVAVEGAEYYELKNRSVAQARAPIVVFLDSDVVPDEGWLEHLLAPFEDPDVGVVVGSSYVGPAGAYGKAFALLWFMDLRPSDKEVCPIKSFVQSNNLAVRREVALRFPFPATGEASRGGEQKTAARMTAAEIRIVKASGASASHPPPNGLRHFLIRAAATGRDRVILGHGWWRTPPGTIAVFGSAMIRDSVSLWRGRRAVRLSPAELPVAAGITVAFRLATALAELATIVNRRFMVERFRI